MRMLRLLEIGLEASSTTNPLLNEDGQFVKPEEAVRNFASLWKEWALWDKLLDNLPKIILAVAVLVFGFLLASLVSKILCKAMKRRKVDFAVYNFIAKITRFVIRITFILIALSMFIKINSLIAALSAAGVAIGLGLQDSVSQFASGVQILINHPFKAGDYVEIGGEGGFVSEIGFMTTIITSYDNKRIIIPNSDITKNRIINFFRRKNTPGRSHVFHQLRRRYCQSEGHRDADRAAKRTDFAPSAAGGDGRRAFREQHRSVLPRVVRNRRLLDGIFRHAGKRQAQL